MTAEDPTPDRWLEAALDAWLDELEAAEACAVLADRRVAAAQGPAAEVARRWLARGRPDVALSLLDRPAAERSPLRRDRPPPPAGDRFGLPTLDDAEVHAYAVAGTPAEALEVLGAAGRRLREHGARGRALLARRRARGG